MPSVLHHITGLSRAVGWPSTMNILARRLAQRSGTISSRLKNMRKDIELSPVDSDLFVLAQIFGWREYDPGETIKLRLNEVARKWRATGVTPLVIDGGANVGYSALFFSQAFPQAEVIAAEPERKTFQRLSRNCAGIPAIRPVHAAIWKHNEGVRFELEDRGSWSNHVGEEGELVPSLTLERLCKSEHPSRILVLKLDVEGAEREIIEACPEIVGSAMCIMIEPHDFMHPGAAGLEPLFRALAGRDFDTLVSGENLFFLSPELTKSR